MKSLKHTFANISASVFQKQIIKLLTFLLILTFVLSSCGGPEEDSAEGTINLNFSVNARAALPDSAKLARISYTVTLQGNAYI